MRSCESPLSPRTEERSSASHWGLANSKRCDASRQTRRSCPGDTPQGRLKTAAPWGGADDRTLCEIGQTSERWKTARQIAIGARGLCQGAAVSNRPWGVSPGGIGASAGWRSSSECQWRSREGRHLAAQPGASRQCWCLPIFVRLQPTAAQAKRTRPSLRSTAKDRETATGSPLQGGHRWSVARSVARKRRFRHRLTLN